MKEAVVRALLEHSGVGFWQITPGGHTVYINHAMCLMLGVDGPEALKDRTFHPYFTDETLARMQIEHAIRSEGKHSQYEGEILRSDGSRIQVMISGSPIVGDDGSHQGMIASFSNISDRHSAEREKRDAELALRTSELRFRLAAQSASDFIYDWDIPGNYLEWFGAIDECLGYPQGGFPRTIEAWEEIIHPEDRPGIMEAFQEHFRSRKPFDVRYRVICTNGAVRYWHDAGTGVWNEEGTPIRMVGACKDVTGQTQQQQELSDLNMALQNAVEGIARLDLRGAYLSANLAYGNMLGYDAEELTGKNWLVTVHDRDRNRARAAYQELLLHGKVEIELRCLRKGGTDFHAGMVMISSFNPKHEITGHYCFIKDISDRKESESRIKQLAAFPRFNPYAVLEFSAKGEINYCNDAAHELARATGHSHPSEILPKLAAEIVQNCLLSEKSLVRYETLISERTISWSFFPIPSLRIVHCYASDITERIGLESQLRQAQKMESIGRLAAGVAHDFNNILNIILGHADLLHSQPSLEAGDIKSVEQIILASERATSLTRQLLAFSRKQHLLSKPFQVNELVRRLTQMLPSSLNMRIHLNLMEPDDSSTIAGDSNLIEQSLMNLILNARDSLNNQGDVGIRTAAVSINAAYCQQNPEASPGDYIRLSVKDTGSGIPPEILPRIFDPFFTTKEMGRGTGLGLATVYGIIKQHGGWIEVESQVNLGTEFFVFLPQTAVISPPLPVPGLSESHQDTPPSGAFTILVVEDEDALRECVTLLLQNSGYQVLATSGGLEALELWEANRSSVHLVFTDLVMPGMSGWVLGEELRKRDPKVRIVYTSGYSADILAKDWGISEGVNFLSKPYDLKTLAQTIRAACAKPA